MCWKSPIQCRVKSTQLNAGKIYFGGINIFLQNKLLIVRRTEKILSKMFIFKRLGKKNYFV